jgi:hypothetical protein
MKLIHLNVDGTARIENAQVTQRMIEMPDGYHPKTNDSVWQDSKRKRSPIIFLIEGVLGPYGASMTREDILHELYDSELAERAMKQQSVSKMNWRWIQQLIGGLAKYGVVLFFVALVGWALYNQYFGGNA